MKIINLKLILKTILKTVLIFTETYFINKLMKLNLNKKYLMK